MLFWLIIGALSIAVLAAVAWPLFREHVEASDGTDYDIEVFRDQLVEIGREFADGRLSREQAEAARAEIARRILAADARRGEAAADPAGGTGRTALATVLSVLIVGGSAAVYLRLGAPDQPALPFAERAGERAQVARSDAGSMNLETLAERLRQRLERGEGGVEGWQLLGRTFMQLGRYGDAVPAFERALGLGAADAGLQASYGEAMTLAADGTVTPRARTAFEAALAADPGDPTARYYLALARHQAGEHREALDGWAALMADSPADAPWIDVLRQRAGEAAGKLGLDVAAVLPQPKPPAAPQAVRPAQPTQPAQPGTPAAPGPSQADMAAAQQMSPEDRQAMIRGMVDGLAAKLEENPGDFQGWMRLIRSYGVLGEKAKAEAALARALARFDNAPFVRQQLLALAGEQGLAAPDGAPAAPAEPSAALRGPSAEQMRAAQEMSPEDRRQMIEGMVAGLAARLEQDPSDLQGWIRLARSYSVLGKPEAARDAMGRAAQVAPDNVDILTLHARTIRAAAGEKPTEESLRIMQKVLALDPDNVEALFFTGLAAANAGEAEAARSAWQKAVTALPAGSPERTALQRRIDGLGK